MGGRRRVGLRDVCGTRASEWRWGATGAASAHGWLSSFARSLLAVRLQALEGGSPGLLVEGRHARSVAGVPPTNALGVSWRLQSG
jgi:hypothetical protein